MPSEPKWSRAISNSTVCSWFFLLAVLNAVFAVVGLLIMLMSKNRSGFVPIFIGSGIGFVNAWFLFLVCNRGLNEGFKVKKA